MKKNEIEKIEIEILLDSIYKRYGYDFRDYAKASLKRRINSYLIRSGYNCVSDLIPALLHNDEVFRELAYNFSITVTEMFRDPFVYKAIREIVIPYLKTFPLIRVWHAGCATGEEVYSLAILLKEEGLYDRSIIYATDFNDTALNIAKKAIYPVKNIKLFTSNYQKSGGLRSFSEYYYSKYDNIVLKKELKKNITFANHNLVTDKSINEMHLIMCRNVLIYFNKELQKVVFELFYESLSEFGLLCLGTAESVQYSDRESDFVKIADTEKIYQKKSKR
ncbi:MAG: protein-glutamate O-methyltransferase CheR [bacterium]|nr:protein-glutamate O-methyltransferase CheR [bacterium]